MDLVQQGLAIFIIFYVLLSVIFTTAFVIKVIRTVILTNKMAKTMNNIKDAFDKVKLVRIVDSNNRFMMYDLMTEHFFCWADTREELWESASRIFPDLDIIEAPDPTSIGIDVTPPNA